MGYGIHNRFWRNGFGNDAVRAALEIAFKQLKVFRVDAHIHRENLASIKLAKKVGMRREGTLKDFNELQNKRVDNDVYAITAYEWGVRGYKPTYGLSLEEIVF